MNKEEMEKLVKCAYEGYLEMAEEENKIIIDLNGFDEDVKEYLIDKHIDDEDYYYSDDEDFFSLTSKLNDMLIALFKENGYTVYTAGNFYVEDGKFVDVMPDTAVAIKE